MLAINGGVNLWYTIWIRTMMVPIYLYQKTVMLKMIRYKKHKRVLYDITYEKGYKFMKPVMKNHEVVYELDFKYLVALLECPTIKELEI